MSLLSSDDLEGFCELLDCFGVELTYAEAAFRAVLTARELEVRAFDMTPGDDQAVRIAAFADAFAARPRIGEYFEDALGNRYRITAWRQRPGQPVIQFTCTVITP